MDCVRIDDVVYLGNEYACNVEIFKQLENLTDIFCIQDRPSSEYNQYYDRVRGMEDLNLKIIPEPIHIKQESYMFHKLSFDDNSEEDILSHLPWICEILKYLKLNGKRALIHCHAGISRSPSVVIAWLIYDRHWSYDTSLEFVRRKRPEVDPVFTKQLIEWEHQII